MRRLRAQLILVAGIALFLPGKALATDVYEIKYNILRPSALGCSQLTDEFDKVVCRAHLGLDSLEDDFLGAVVVELQGAQRQGLVPAQQSLAEILEGLLHCQMAKLEYDATFAANQLQSVGFCAARSAGMSVLASLELPSDTQIRYEAGSGNSVEGLFQRVAGCYAAASGPQGAGPLNVERGVQCERGPTRDPNVRAEEINALVAGPNGVYTELRQEYLIGASAALTGMFTRKKNIAEGVVTQLQAELTVLDSEAKAAAARALALKAYYDNNIDGQLTPLMEAYIEVLKTTFAIQKSYASWRGGLFTPAGGTRNYALELQNQIGQMVGSGTTPGIADALDGNTSVVRKINGDPSNPTIEPGVGGYLSAMDNEQKGLTREYCRVYYCGLSPKPTSWFATDFFALTCGQIQNPLCAGYNASTTPGQMTYIDQNGNPASFTVETLCTEAGFDPAAFTTTTTRPIRLTEGEAIQCW